MAKMLANRSYSVDNLLFSTNVDKNIELDQKSTTKKWVLKYPSSTIS